MLLPIKAGWWTWCYSLLELLACLNLEKLIFKLWNWKNGIFMFVGICNEVYQLICILYENQWKISISLSKERGHCCPFTREYWFFGILTRPLARCRLFRRDKPANCPERWYQTEVFFERTKPESSRAFQYFEERLQNAGCGFERPEAGSDGFSVPCRIPWHRNQRRVTDAFKGALLSFMKFSDYKLWIEWLY